MCLILLALDQHPKYRLVLAANRDEYYDRPTAALRWWSDHPDVLAGRDLKSGGTWLGITRSGRLAAVTNYREPGRNDPEARSRGQLVSGFLTSDLDPRAYLAAVRRQASTYNGFNLLVGDRGGLFYFSNRSRRGPIPIGAGVHGLSNHLLDTPWPKVRQGTERLRAALEGSEQELEERVLALLDDRTVSPDDQLPDTGVGRERERMLAPIFIASPTYGTRSSHAVLIDRAGTVTFVEQPCECGERRGARVRFRFDLLPDSGPGSGSD